MVPLQFVLALLMIFVTLSLLVFSLRASRNEKKVQARVEQVVQTPSSMAASSQKRKIEATFTQRVIIPFAQQLSGLIQAIVPTTGKSWIRQKLVQAGFTKPQHFKTFLGVHAIATCLPLGFMAFMVFVSGNVKGPMALGIMAFFGGMGFIMPLLWLIQNATKRQDSIRKALPDFLDLLIICVEAGLGLDMAISKMVKVETVQTSPYLKEELTRYTVDIGLGKRRKDALLDLANRTGVEDLNSVINAMIQAYEMGTGVTQTLRVQADSLRQKRMHRAEEAANKISVKMVMPIYLFFFPGIFIVTLGPMILYTITEVMHAMRNNPVH
jgi:tight adherence protein C